MINTSFTNGIPLKSLCYCHKPDILSDSNIFVTRWSFRFFCINSRVYIQTQSKAKQSKNYIKSLHSIQWIMCMRKINANAAACCLLFAACCLLLTVQYILCFDANESRRYRGIAWSNVARKCGQVGQCDTSQIALCLTLAFSPLVFGLMFIDPANDKLPFKYMVAKRMLKQIYTMWWIIITIIRLKQYHIHSGELCSVCFPR